MPQPMKLSHATIADTINAISKHAVTLLAVRARERVGLMAGSFKSTR